MVEVSESDYPSTLTITVEGRGRGGIVRGKGALRLQERDGGTELAVEGEAQVSGLIARVGQRLVGGAARMMMGQFFGCIREKTEEGG